MASNRKNEAGRRILSGILAVIMIFSLLAGTALAASSSKYSAWTKSNGTASYSIITKTSSSTSTATVTVSGVKRVGIDVSSYQGDIDWEKVAASGISYAIIRCGYGSDYESQDDKYFLENVQGALEAGLDIGVYLYSYATQLTGDDSSAESEAAHVLRLLEEAGLEPEDLALPVYLDMENSTQGKLGTSMLGDIAETFCSIIEQAGYKVGIYANLNWWNNYLTDDVFETESWYKWVARYPTSTSVTSCGADDANMWQFTSSGTVSGISGSVDVNFDYLGADGYVTYVPGQVTLTSVSRGSTNTTATVKWETLKDASGYLIYRSAGGGSYELAATVTGASTSSWTDTSLSGGTLYTYKVGAYIVSSGGTYYYGSLSDAVSVITRPDTVTLSSATASSSGSVTVRWRKVSNATGYVIYRSENGGSYTAVKTISSNSTLYWTDSTVSSGTAYSYKIAAYTKVSGSTVYSASYSNIKTVITKPDTVTISSAAATSAGYVTVKWKKVANSTGYVIYRSVDGGSYSKVADVSSNSTVSWTDTTVSAGHTYRYKIKAYKTYSGSTVYSTSYSSVKSITAKPAVPTIQSVSSTSAKTATVRWKAVSGASGYQVAYRTAGGSWAYKTVTTSLKTLTGLKSGSTYYVKVRAYTSYNGTKVYSSWSSQKTITVK